MSAPTGRLFWLVLRLLHLKHHHQKTGSRPPTNSRGGCGTHLSHLRHANPTSFPCSTILSPSPMHTSRARHGRRPVGLTEPSLCHGGTPYCAERQSQCVEVTPRIAWRGRVTANALSSPGALCTFRFAGVRLCDMHHRNLRNISLQCAVLRGESMSACVCCMWTRVLVCMHQVQFHFCARVRSAGPVS